MDATYNGWRNRETWCVGLHLMDTVTEWITDSIDEWSSGDVEDAAELFKDLVVESIAEAELLDHPMLWDLLDLSMVDYQELGKSALATAFA